MTHIFRKNVCDACNAVLATRAVAATPLPWPEFKRVVLENQAVRADCAYGPCMYMKEGAPRLKLSVSPDEPLSLTEDFAKTHNLSKQDRIVARRYSFFPVQIIYAYHK